MRITWVNLRGTGFVRMCKEMSLTQDSDTWQEYEIINTTLIIQLPYLIGNCSETKHKIIY